MKALFGSLFFLALTGASAFCQSPAFHQAILKSLKYPADAYSQEKVAKAYVSYKIDAQGKVTDISIVNKDEVDGSFQQEISRVWNQLPTLEKESAGTYVVPVSFILDYPNRVRKPNIESPLASLTSPYTLVDEVTVTSYL